MPLRSWNTLGRAVLGALETHARARGLGDLTTVDLRQAIVDQASFQGVPPAIAVAVAMRESGIMQYRPDSSLVTGAAGEIGIFQLLPATAAQLGVDSADPLQNIQGGVAYLAQMYAQFGSWPLALAAYNWGPVKVQRALQSGGAIPASVQSYVAAIVAAAGIAYVAQAPSPVSSQTFAPTDFGSAGADLQAGTSGVNGPLILLGMAAAIVGVEWLLD